jgi:hypothetical protein
MAVNVQKDGERWLEELYSLYDRGRCSYPSPWENTLGLV